MRTYIALQLEDRTQGPKAMQERTLFGVFDFAISHFQSHY